MYSKKLTEIINRNGIKKRDLAKVLNIDESTYSHYESENNIMPIKHLNTICNYLDVSIDYIFSLTEQKNYKNYRKEIDKQIMSKRLKEFRKENNLTQVKLANILNIANGTIAEYERGKNIIATPFLYFLCKNYGISADYVLGKVDNTKNIRKIENN